MIAIPEARLEYGGRETKAGAVTSILAGTVVSLAWNELDFLRDKLPAAISGLDAVLPAITVSVLCLIVVSLLTKNQPFPARGEELGQ